MPTPLFEALEPRNLLSGMGPLWDAGGDASTPVVATGAIVVNANTGTAIVNGGKMRDLEITPEGIVRDGHQVHSFNTPSTVEVRLDPESVTSILLTSPGTALRVVSDDGNNRIDVETRGWGGTAPLDVITGGGNDRVRLTMLDSSNTPGSTVYRPGISLGNGHNSAIVTADVGVSVYGGEDSDEIIARDAGGEPFHALLGGAGNDLITSDVPAMLAGGAGNNVLVSRSDSSDGSVFHATGGRNTMIGSSGNDLFVLEGGRNRIWTGDGNNRIEVYEPLASLVLYGGSGLDTLIAAPGTIPENFFMTDIEFARKDDEMSRKG